MNKFSILIVDDDKEFRLFMAETLTYAGFDVVEACNGSHAITILDRRNKLNALITDIQMPGLFDGNQVASRAKILYPDISVVYVSGSPDSLTNDISSQDIFLSKPFRSSLMISEVRRLLHLTDTVA